MQFPIQMTVAVLSCAATTPALLAQQDHAVAVNGTILRPAELADLKRRHGVPADAPIPPGRYWYDKVSGLWGYEGGPTAGQLLPGLALGGPLRSDASASGTGVFINGREIHPLEVAYLRSLFGFVFPGRYWMDSRGIGGYEGGPPFFDLAAAARAAGSMGGGDGGHTRRTTLGGIRVRGELHQTPETSKNCNARLHLK